MTNVAKQLTEVRSRIASACARSGRDPSGVRLIAISKKQPTEALVAAARSGQNIFGENYLQEALGKIGPVEAGAGRPLEWHFTGPLQSNKTADIAAHFAWVHGVDRLRIAERLSTQRPAGLPPLSVCVQVNISGEDSKSGCLPEQAPRLCADIAALPGVHLRGLMCLPQAMEDPESTRPAFRALRQLLDSIRASDAVDPGNFDTLSMGMSNDFEIAIEEGATQIRVGTAIFGTRDDR